MSLSLRHHYQRWDMRIEAFPSHSQRVSQVPNLSDTSKTHFEEGIKPFYLHSGERRLARANRPPCSTFKAWKPAGWGEWPMESSIDAQTCCFPQTSPFERISTSFGRMVTKSCAVLFLCMPYFVGYFRVFVLLVLRLCIPNFLECIPHAYFERLSLNLENQTFMLSLSFMP